MRVPVVGEMMGGIMDLSLGGVGTAVRGECVVSIGDGATDDVWPNASWWGAGEDSKVEIEWVMVGVDGSVERFGEGGKKRSCWRDRGDRKSVV